MTGIISATSIASFLDGTYHISSKLGRVDAAIAATHEEMHGIIRRSSFYGLLLSRAAAEPVEDNLHFREWAHWISSRARTSEEVVATFAALSLAGWSGRDTAAGASLALKVYPEYNHYYQLGSALTRDIETPYFRSAVLEGLVRFCWCSEHIRKFSVNGEHLKDLVTLPSLAFPDNRLYYLRKHWIGSMSRELNCALKKRYRQFIETIKKNYPKIDDLKHDTMDHNPRLLFVHTANGAEAFAQMQYAIVLSMAVLNEQIVNFVIDGLSRSFRGTDLASPRSRDIMRFLEAQSDPTSNGKTLSNAIQGIGIIEVVVNRSHKRRVTLQIRPESTVWFGEPIVGLRSWDSLQSNFELSTTAMATHVEGSCALYGFAVPEPNTTEDAFCKMGLKATFAEQAPSSARQLVHPPAVLAIWSALFIDNIAYWDQCIHTLAAERWSVWIICDIEPNRLIRMMMPMLSEANGLFYSGSRGHDELGFLIVRQLGPFDRRTKPVQGLIFPGLRHTLEMIVDKIQREMGDNFHGAGHGPDLHEESFIRRREGERLSEWLLFSELTFGYK